MRMGLLASFVLLVASVAQAAEAKKPNILFIFADDWGRYASAYAKIDGPGTLNDLISTPNFDRIAREGVLFRRAYVSAPSCTPCRSALFSGQHFWRTGRGAILVGAIWDGSNPSYPLLLKDGGYQIGETYKAWSPGSPNDAVFGVPPASYESAGNKFNHFSSYVTGKDAQGKSIEDAKQELYDEVRNNFDSFLADRKAGEPFYYHFGPTNVHRKWIRGSGKALWGLDPEKLTGKVPNFLPDVPEVREDIADYFGEIQALDAAMGVLLQRLEETGELDNTLIVVSGDHGAPGFTHGKCNLYDFGVGVSLAISGPGVKGGRVVDDLVSMTDLAPTYLEVAGLKIPDVMTGRSLVNVLSSDKSGQVDPKRDAVYFGRERHVEEARDDYLPYPQRAVRTHDYLYIVNFKPDRWPNGNPYGLDSASAFTHDQLVNDTRLTLRDMDSSPTKAWLIEHRDEAKWKRYYDMAFAKRPREELYILKDDPDEIHNVAADPKYAEVRTKAEARLMDELRRTGDPRLVDDGKFFETPPMAGPVDKPPQRAKNKNQQPPAKKKGKQ